jgi:HK97 family phage portal protein
MPDFFADLASAAGFVRKEKAVIPSVYASGGGDPFSIWKSSKKVDASKAFDVYTGWVYACIRAIAEEIGTMRFELYRLTDEEGTQERIYRHEILDTLLAPNSQQTGMELLYTIAAHLESIGNAYIFLDGVKDAKGKPTALYVLDASKVKVIADRNIFPATVLKYEYRTSTKEYTFEPYQILHIKYPDPADPFEGIGTVQTGMLVDELFEVFQTVFAHVDFVARGKLV